MDGAEVPVIRPPAFKNRRGLLIAVGVVQILIGCFFLLLAALMTFVTFPAVKGSADPFSAPGMRLILVCIYAVPALIFVSLGIGSVLAKNWARIGTLVVSWMWLGFGVLQLVMLIFIMPAILRAMPPQPNQPQGFPETATIVAGVIVGAFGIVLPAIFLAIYHSKHVRATCLSESNLVAGAAQVVGAQTAGRPQSSVILWILTIWMGLGAISLVVIVFTRYPAVIFGQILGGLAGKLVYLLTAIVYSWVAWGLIHRHQVAWRVGFWLNVLWMASAIVTFSSRDIIQLYREMGMAAEELAILERLPIFANYFALLCLLPALIFIGLLYYAKKYMAIPNTAGA